MKVREGKGDVGCIIVTVYSLPPYHNHRYHPATPSFIIHSFPFLFHPFLSFPYIALWDEEIRIFCWSLRARIVGRVCWG